jgi:hypothetical protein
MHRRARDHVAVPGAFMEYASDGRSFAEILEQEDVVGEV